MRRLVADLWDLSCIAVPLVAIVGVPGAVVAAAMGWWSVAAALAVLAVGAVVAIVLPRRRRPAPVAATGVRIVAANLWNKNPVMAQAARDLVALRPDVLIVSELGQAAHEVLVEAFAHHEVLSIGGPRGHGVYATVPLERLPDLPLIGPVLPVRVHAAEPFRLFASHTPRGTILPHDADGTAVVQRCRDEMFRLAELAEAEPDTVVAGDLNLVDRQPGYRRLVRGRIDAMRTVRARGTFHGHVVWIALFMRIDHLVVPADWSVADARVVRISGSDHRAITAVVRPGA